MDDIRERLGGESVGEILEVPPVEEGDVFFYFRGEPFNSYDEAEAARMAEIRALRDQVEAAKNAPSQPLDLPRLESHPHDFPEPGIYFGMPDDVYHAIPAISTSGIKKFASSPMLFWATCPWLNHEWAEIKKEEEEKRKKDGADHFDVGHAYHCRLLEGASTFAMRFAIALDKADFPNALVTVDDIKAAFPEGLAPKGKLNKGELFERLREYDATVELWDDIKAEHAKKHEGMTFIGARTYRQLEIAAAMIERDPELREKVTGGHPEVALFWYCPRTGLPMKAKVDYLKIGELVDLKTVQNSQEASIENVIRRDIANRRYVIQPAVYFEGATAVRELVRSRGASAVHVWPNLLDASDTEAVAAETARQAEIVTWALRWAKHDEPDNWLWIYQQKGIAPVARGVYFPRRGTLMMLANDLVAMMKKRIRQHVEVFGLDPWLDVQPIYDLADEDLPPWATEI